MADWLTWIATATSTGVPSGLVGYFVAKRQSQAGEHASDATLASQVTKPLMQRIETLERRDDQRMKEMSRLQAHVEKCEEDNERNRERAEECEERYKDLESRVKSVEQSFARGTWTD